MRNRKLKPLEWPPSHPRYDPDKPLLRELVLVEVATDREEYRTILLTRVPCVGEEIAIEADTFKVTRVLHAVVDDDGRAFCGTHAYVDALWQPEEPRKPRKRKR
jgi:hypothetical protein